MHDGTARGYQVLGCRAGLDGVAGFDELSCGYDVAGELPNVSVDVEADGSQRQLKAAGSEAGNGGAATDRDLAAAGSGVSAGHHPLRAVEVVLK